MMISRSVAVWLLACTLPAWVQSQSPLQPQSSNQEIPLWPGGAPGALGDRPEDKPSLTSFLTATKPTGAAIVVCPGGGYARLAPHEGAPVAEWLNSLGVKAFVLKYRLGTIGYHHPAMLQDAQRAIRYVRSHAAEFGIDAHRIGILGFSAGGHVASSAGTHFDAGNPASTDAVERASSRPDLMVLIYPVITMGEGTHHGSHDNLLGKTPPADLVHLMSNEEQVTKDTPAAFLIHTVNDATVPVSNSLGFAQALEKAGVPFELHVFEKGPPHGYGLAANDPWSECGQSCVSSGCGDEDFRAAKVGTDCSAWTPRFARV